MRLFELFENVPSSVSNHRMARPRTIGDERLQMAGSGSFADVYQDRDNPHEVMKFSTGDLAYRDGYLDYIKEIAANEDIQSNPWAPRILSFRVHNNKHGEVQDFSARIENLSRFDSMSRKQAIALSERIFVPKISKRIATQYNPAHNKTLTPLQLEYYRLQHIVAHIRDCVSDAKKAPSITIDEQLIEFSKWHTEAFAKYRDDHAFDLSAPNIMIRRSPYGVQPVITDPWA